MQIAKSRKIPSLYCVFILLLSISPVTFSAHATFDGLDNSISMAPQSVWQSDVLILAETENLDADDEQPRSGSLLLPAAADEEKREKKCMTVCQRWGQACMIDTTRGVRKCRRTCKEFGQECF